MKTQLSNRIAAVLAIQIFLSGFAVAPVFASEPSPYFVQSQESVKVIAEQPRQEIVIREVPVCAATQDDGQIRFEVLLNFNCFDVVVLAAPILTPRVAVVYPETAITVTVANETQAFNRLLISSGHGTLPNLLIPTTEQGLSFRGMQVGMVQHGTYLMKTKYFKVSPNLAVLQIFRC